MNPLPIPTSADECFRCGYNLHSISNENACPECGLLAERSRRSTQELHDTHPRWLKNIHWGLNLILLSAIVAIVWPICFAVAIDGSGFFNFGFNELMLPVLRGAPAGILFFLAIFVLTRPEGYAPVDQSDRNRRLALRIFAAVPFLLLFLPTFFWLLQFPIKYLVGAIFVSSQSSVILTQEIGLLFIALIVAPLPYLLFTHLRAVAIRAHCNYLPHDCLVLGIGMAAMIVGLPALIISQQLGLGSTLVVNQLFGLIFGLFIFLVCAFFVVWAIYLLVNFSLTFRKVRRDLRTRWKLHDFSLTHKEMGNSPA